jgi:hypothetical protein
MGRQVCKNIDCEATGDMVGLTGYCSETCWLTSQDRDTLIPEEPPTTRTLTDFGELVMQFAEEEPTKPCLMRPTINIDIDSLLREMGEEKFASPDVSGNVLRKLGRVRP